MMRLALELGAPHPDFLEEELTMRQVSEWVEFYHSEPWGYEAADTRNALLALVTASSQGAKARDGGPLRLEQFRIRPHVESETGSEYELANKIRAIFKIPREG